MLLEWRLKYSANHTGIHAKHGATAACLRSQHHRDRDKRISEVFWPASLTNWLVPGPSERLRLRKQGGHCRINNSWQQGLASTCMCTHMHFVLLHINTQKHICIHSYIHKITVNWRNISFVLHSDRPTSSSIFEVPVYSRYSSAEVGWLVHKESWEELSKRRK